MLHKDILLLQLKELGLSKDDIVMLHASMRAIGNVLGGPDQVHQAIMEAIAPHGTLMMYVSCEREYEALGRRELTNEEEQDIYQHCPAFNPATARARRDHGILAEFFRSWPHVICSDNPGARMAAIGDKARWLLDSQPLQYGYGEGSPLAKLYDSQGKILLLGSDLDQVTILHYAEHIAPIEDKRKVRFKVPLLQNNQRVWFDIEEYDTSIGIRQWPDSFFEKIIKSFLVKNAVEPKKVGLADSYLLDAKLLVDFAVSIFVSEANQHL